MSVCKEEAENLETDDGWYNRSVGAVEGMHEERQEKNSMKKEKEGRKDGWMRDKEGREEESNRKGRN